MIKGYLSRQLPHGQAFRLAWPMILANISTPTMGLVDTAMLGHLDSARFMGAVAIGANVLAFMFWVFAFLRMGTTSLAGRAFGAENVLEVLGQLFRNSAIAVTLGLLIIALQFITIPLAMKLMAPEMELRALASSYCHIRIHSAPAVLVTYVIIGWFIGLHNTRIPLLITVSANLLNIALDYLFIMELGWESDGAAIASLTAEYFALLLGVISVAGYLHKAGWRLTRPIRYFEHVQWRALFNFNSDLFIRTSILLFVFNFFTAQSADLGQYVLAANAIIMQLVMFTSLALDGYAHAAETMIARATGARSSASFYRASAATTVAAVGIALVLSGSFWLSSGIIGSLMSDLPAVRQTLSAYTIWLYLLPLTSVWCYLLDGIFIGAGKTRIMRNYMLIAVLLIFIPLWWLLRPLNNHGLWAAFTVFNFFRGVSLGFAYLRLSASNRWF